MRGKLGAVAGRRTTFIAAFEQLEHQGQVPTVLLRNVRLSMGELLSKRERFPYTEAFGYLNLVQGDIVQFDAYVEAAYRPGDCRLTDPTHLKKLPFDLWRGLDSTRTFDATWPEKAERLRLERLTKRERQMLDLLANGHRNDQIAEQLGLSGQTVRNCLSAVYRKLGVRSHAEAVMWVREHELLP